ncbi:NADH-quinone oxidoreductase subunit NuoK [Streptomycetaceae bacterium NBC_01309]
MHLVYPLILAVLLFCVGLYGVLARRNAILVLMSVELMLNAVNINLVAFDMWLRDTLHAGQALTLFVITIAAAEIGLGLAIVLMVFRSRATSDVSALRDLGEPGAVPAPGAPPGAPPGPRGGPSPSPSGGPSPGPSPSPSASGAQPVRGGGSESA